MTGADERNRTVDLLITNELLYQLSYIGLVKIISELAAGEPSCGLHSLLCDCRLLAQLNFERLEG